MRFQVPQFIDVEDKIFGPLSFKQFVYLVGTGGLAYILWETLPAFFAILLALPVIGLGVALAFYKVNNKPFIFTLQAALRYALHSKLYIWKKEQKKKKDVKKEESTKQVDEIFIPRLSDSKLKEISWSLGIKDSLYAEGTGSQAPEERK